MQHPPTRAKFNHRLPRFDKSCEQVTWTQVIPYTDRLNYASALINNVGYALAVEKLIGTETPPRCQYIRVIVSELARVFDHLTCCGMAASELGAITVGFYMIEARELITRIIEDLTGARLTVTYVRIGGVKHDLPDGFAEGVRQTFRTIRRLLEEAVVVERGIARQQRLQVLGHRDVAGADLREAATPVGLLQVEQFVEQRTQRDPALFIECVHRRASWDS